MSESIAPKGSGDKFGALLARLREKREAALPTRIQRMDRERSSHPLSAAQQRLWFIDQLEPGSPAYNMPNALRLTGDLATAVLARTLSEIVIRHESLRTTFAARGGDPVAVIHPPGPVPLPVVDLAALPRELRESTARQLAAEEARRTFRLAEGPLLRATLLRLDPREHLLLLTMHHVVSDGWSMGILVSEASVLYRAFLEGRPSGLPPLPIQYADYAVWQRDWLQGEVLERQLGWWKSHLAGAPAILDLPADHPRLSVRRSRGGLVPVRVRPEVARELAAFGRSREATLFMLYLAAFQELLGHLTGREDLVVGTPVAGRTRPELSELIGLFVNTLALRGDLAGDPTFVEHLGRVREATLGAHAHQDLPFERLVDELAPERNLTHTPVFQVLFVFQDVRRPLELSGLTWSPVEAESGAAKFDLTLTLFEDDGGLGGHLGYNRDLFDDATVRRWSGHLEVLLEGIAREPQRRLWERELLSAPERHQVLLAWNDTALGVVSETIHELCVAQARRTPQAVAVRFEGSELSFGELDRRSNQVARYLRSFEVGPDVLVGLCMERSLELMVALLGILKAGGGYVPLDPGYPPDRLAYMVENSNAPVLLSQRRLIDRLPESAAQRVFLDADWERIASESTDELEIEVDTENLAAVLYTSGSTGRPKGVMHPHRNVVNQLLWMQATYGLDATDRLLQKTPISWDVSQWELFWSLTTGSTLVIARPGGHQDPEYMAATIASAGITMVHFVPSMLRIFLDVVDAWSFPSLRRVLSSGEALTLDLEEKFFSLLPMDLHNIYGPGESARASLWKCERGNGWPVAPIGRPAGDVQLYVLDRALEPAPIGVSGELYVGGQTLARGYYRRADLTAEKFLPNPFGRSAGEPGSRLYRTGDLARTLPDGKLEFLGRIDHQVKIRGVRIELGEIEAVLGQHPKLADAVVMARASGSGEKRLAAYVVPEDGVDAVGIEELREHLRVELPDYMIPESWTFLEALPLTPNGKVDRLRLPEPEMVRPDLGADYVAPRTPEEVALAEVWARVLEVDRVGIHDNFFTLGGDSIRSIRVLSLAAARGLRFSLPQLFQHQTIAELAPHRLAASAAPATPARSDPFSLVTAAERAALPPDVEDAYPVSALQLGMLFHSGYGEHAAAYHNVRTLRLSRAIDMAALRRAAAQLAGRHPVLRTSFDLGAFSRPLQLVHRAAELPVTEEDLSGLGSAEREEAIARRFEDEMARRFDWRRPPLLRFHVQHLGAGETQLFWTQHHSILDGWSTAVLLSELFRLYQAELGGAAVPPAPASLYREFIALEREVLESEEARDFWSDRLRDADPARLLPWHAEEADKDRTPINVPIPEPVLAGLRALAEAAGVPQKNVFLAAHVWVIGRITGTRDVMTGLVTNGRPEAADADRVLGLFLNTVPLRVALSGGTWLDLARQMLEAERDILPFRRFPLPEIQRELGAARLFETSFNYINFYVLAEAEQASGLQLDSARYFGETSIPLAVDFNQDVSRDTVRLNAQRDPAVLNQDQLRAIVDLYLRVLAAMALEPGARYDLVDLLSAMERQQILVEWNDTALVSHLESEVAHEVFEHWAALTPEAPALRWSQGELSYRDLNRQANRIARRLQASGAGPEVAVGLYVQRSPEMIAGLLGILKAGAAYVPLDPAYPRERLLTMIEDVHMPLVLTQERLAEGIAGLVRQAMVIDRLGETGPEDDANPRSGVIGARADNLAYAIFTSGSTGRPKPVGVSHRALTWHMAGTRQVLHMAEHENDTVLQFSTLNFDGSVDQVFIALVNGDCLALREEEMWSAEELEERIAQMGLTIIDLPTGYWSEWVRARSSAPAREDRLRVVYVGGEAMLAEELAVWWRSPRNRNVRLLNAYGPTETVVAASYLEATSRESAGPLFDRVAIGHPLRGRTLHVVDPDGRLSPVGVTGELLIGGEPILARGYLGRPDLTAERFVPDPFSPLPGARLYRTGDLGRYLPDGRREFLGRVDDQVKVRGFRIELGEVETALAEHPAVHRAAAVVHGKGQKRLVAYVTFGDPQQEPTAEELRAFLRGKLPEPMVPSDIVILDRLPLTPNGKVDRRALPVPELSARRNAGPTQAPRSDVELQLAGIWEELLEVSPIGVTDDFLELGGHSLLAVRLMARLEHVFGVKLPISVLFEAPTVERLAAVLQGREAPVRRSPLVRLHPGGAGRPLFVVHPVGGDVFAYVGLARRLGTDRPVYGLQAVAEGNGHQPTMEELAAQYLAAVREVQPEGPYLLAGWSLGAVIAWEMAQQIESSGASVGLLAMIDPSSPQDGRREGIDDTSLLEGFAADLVRLSGRSVPFGREVLEGLDLDAGLDRLVALGRSEGVLPPDVDKPRLRERFNLFSRHVKALQAYAPRAYGGRVALFRASASLPPGSTDPTSGWGELASAEAHLFEADHYSLLNRPALEGMVERLRSALATAEGAPH